MVAFTKEAIKRSFWKLLEERPLSQITVKDVAETCGISRNSFYYHFDDIPTLLTEIVTENADHIIAQHAAVNSLEDCLEAAVQFALQNKRALMHVYRSINRDICEQYLMKICHYVIVAYADTVFGALPVRPEDKDIVIRFYQCELFGQIIEWMNHDMKYDINAQFRRLGELWNGMTEELVRRCASSP